MKTLSLILLLSLGGCTLGLSAGQHWEKAEAVPGEYDKTLARCTAEMRALPTSYDSSLRAVNFIPGNGLVNISEDREARQQFSRRCMMAEGWAVR